MTLGNGLYLDYNWSTTRAISDLAFVRSLGDSTVYDFTDPTTMFENSDGTGAVTGAGQVIGRINDLGASGRHATQAVALNKPMTTLNEFGRLVGVGDVVNDVLEANWDLSAATAVTMVIALRKLSDVAIGFPLSHNGLTNPAVYIRAPNGEIRLRHRTAFAAQ